MPQQTLSPEPGLPAPNISVQPLPGSASRSQTPELDFADLLSSFACTDTSIINTISPLPDEMMLVDTSNYGPFLNFGPFNATKPSGDTMQTIDGAFSPFEYLNTVPVDSTDHGTSELSEELSASRYALRVETLHDGPALQRSDSLTKCNCALPALRQLQSLLLSDIEEMGSDNLIITVVSSENDRAIEHMDRILRSSCSHMEHVFSVVTMLISEVLDRYRAVVRRILPAYNNFGSPPAVPAFGYETPRSLEGPRCEADEARVAAQLILGELHGVQRLIKMFPERAKTDESSPRLSVIHNLPLPNISRKSEPDSFSNDIILAMKTTLNARLRSLAQEILSRLRQD